MPKRTKNAIPKRWRFALHFADGRTEEITVDASCFSAAIFCLPMMKDVGRYRYELLKSGDA